MISKPRCRVPYVPLVGCSTLGCADREPASVHVTRVVRLAQRRHLSSTAVLGVDAPWREAAARPRRDEVGRASWDGAQPAVARVLDPRDRGEQHHRSFDGQEQVARRVPLVKDLWNDLFCS